jgi:hypothetical protein
VIPFTAIPWRLIGIAALAALIGYLMWREHNLVGKLRESRVQTSAERVRADTAAAQILVERAAIAHEKAINKQATDDHEKRIKDLEKGKLDTPVRSVRLRNCAPTGNDMPATTRSASGVAGAGDSEHAGETGRDPANWRVPGFVGDYDRWSEDGPDAGPALYALADEKDLELARCAALQGRVKNQ